MTFLRRLLTLPSFLEREKTRAAKWVYLILLVSQPILAFLTLTLLFSSFDTRTKVQFLVLQAGISALFIMGLYLVRRGYLRFIAFAIVYHDWLVCLEHRRHFSTGT